MAGGGVLLEMFLMKEEEPTPVVPSLPGSYFNQLILLKPETLMYRSSPISPSHRALFATVAEQVTVTWTPVEAENEPAAVAAWFVNVVRPEIGAENALALQQIIEAQWEGTFSTFFRNVADYRLDPGETAG